VADIVAALASLQSDALLAATDVLVRYAWPKKGGSDKSLFGKMFGGKSGLAKDLAWPDAVRAGWEQYDAPLATEYGQTGFVRQSLLQLGQDGDGALTAEHGDEYLTTIALQDAARAEGIDRTLSPATLAEMLAARRDEHMHKSETSLAGRTASMFSKGNTNEDPLHREHIKFVGKERRTRGECVAFLVWIAAKGGSPLSGDRSKVAWPCAALNDERLTVLTTPEISGLVRQADEFAETMRAADSRLSRLRTDLANAESRVSDLEDLMTDGPSRLRGLSDERAKAQATAQDRDLAWTTASRAAQAADSAAGVAQAQVDGYRSAYQPRIDAAADDDARREATYALERDLEPYSRALANAESEAETARRNLDAAAKALDAARTAVLDLDRRVDTLQREIQQAPTLIESARTNAQQAAAALAKATREAEFDAEQFVRAADRLRDARAGQLSALNTAAAAFAASWPAELGAALGVRVRIDPTITNQLYELPVAGIHAVERAVWEVASAMNPAALATLADVQGQRGIGVASIAPVASTRAVLSQIVSTTSSSELLNRARAIPVPEIQSLTYDLTYEVTVDDGGERTVQVTSLVPRVVHRSGSGNLASKLPWSKKG
jgi:predicted  nucleic acid-binding Zn-ribbon protein